ncbi:MAG: hypothetical protein GY782_08680 [Gammaproteobacteria bacterium]|nr:hypothetical protein [Gammaproteobacteria bacterium]
MMNVKEIIIDYLKKNGYDGMVNEFEECGCELTDLYPCEVIHVNECEPGYKKECSCEDRGCEFHMVKEV